MSLAHGVEARFSHDGEVLLNAIPERQSVATMSQVDALYDVRDRGARRLLAANPDLIPDLIDVAKVVPAFFGLDARLALETVSDPEDDAADQELFAVISTTMHPTQALQRLGAFDRDWWLERSRRIGDRLTVTLD